MRCGIGRIILSLRLLITGKNKSFVVVMQIMKAIRHLTFIRSPLLVMRILNGYFRTVLLHQPMLRSIELAVTYACQAQCHKCYAKDLSVPEREPLSISQIRTIINDAMTLGLIHVNITGGEPTLRSDILDVIRACHPRQIMVSLVTNALALSKEKMQALKQAGLNTIQISLDSADSATHDELREVVGCYDAVLRAAQWARECGINLCFSTVLSTEASSNKAEMLKLLALAEREQAFLLICDSADVGGWAGKGEKMFTCEERDRVLKELLKTHHARHHQMYNFRMRSGCPAGIEKIYITAYGDVTPCDLIHEVYGNALAEGLKPVWLRLCAEPQFTQRSKHCIRYLKKDPSFGN
jgi:MoaA/NifB/PqqE/SkfB family radical SAM enzyme